MENKLSKKFMLARTKHHTRDKAVEIPSVLNTMWRKIGLPFFHLWKGGTSPVIEQKKKRK